MFKFIKGCADVDDVGKGNKSEDEAASNGPVKL